MTNIKIIWCCSIKFVCETEYCLHNENLRFTRTILAFSYFPTQVLIFNFTVSYFVFIYSIGRQYARKLSALGINTARQLRDMPDRSARDLMAVGGLKTVRELRGERCFPLDDSPADKQTICVSRSLASEISCPDALSDLLFSFAARGCFKLRRAGLVAGRLQIFALGNRFRPDLRHFSRSVDIGLLPRSNDTRQICTAIGQNVDRLSHPSLQVKKAGILLLDLCRPEAAARDLFTPMPISTSPLMASIDRLEEKFGRDSVVIGRLPRERVDWFTRSENRSPCYTTRWSDIPRFS
ncbi:DUF4113 domain-containing protein [Thalassospira profundimaris]